MFHGPCAIRMNLALPLSRVKEAFERLDKYVFNRDPDMKEPEQQVLAVGDTMPDFTYRTPFAEGETLTAALHKAKKTALLFLRYYGCTLCQYDIQQLAAHYAELTANGGQVLVVLQSDPAVVAGQLQPDTLPFEIICDPKAELYIRFAVQPAESLQAMADEKTMAKIAKATEAGLKHGKYEGWELQLPAAFVMDADGKLTYAHYGKSAGDIPDVEELKQLLS